MNNYNDESVSRIRYNFPVYLGFFSRDITHELTVSLKRKILQTGYDRLRCAIREYISNESFSTFTSSEARELVSSPTSTV
jgi:hypothetical protein